jgi:integrase/recombinase XerD
MLVQIRPKAHEAYRSLPVLGPVLDQFTDWIQSRGYSMRAFSGLFGHIRHLDQYFRRRGLREWRDLTLEHFETAWERLRKRSCTWGGTIRQVQHFLEQVYGLSAGKGRPVSRCGLLMEQYEQYLRDERCFADHNIDSHRSYVRFFIDFLGYERSPSVLASDQTVSHLHTFVKSSVMKFGYDALGSSGRAGLSSAALVTEYQNWCPFWCPLEPPTSVTY